MILLLTTFLISCGGGDTDTEQIAPDVAANPLLNGDFNGLFLFTRNDQPLSDALTLDLSVGSPLFGTFSFFNFLGNGTISGEASGNSATFEGTFDGDCPGMVSGSLALIEENVISFDISGSNCDGPFNGTSILTREGAITGDIIVNTDESSEHLTTIVLEDGGEIDLWGQLDINNNNVLISSTYLRIKFAFGAEAVLQIDELGRPTFYKEPGGFGYIVNEYLGENTVDITFLHLTVQLSAKS